MVVVFSAGTCCVANAACGRGLQWVNHDLIEPAASLAMSATPPKAEVDSEHLPHSDGPWRVDGAARGLDHGRSRPELAPNFAPSIRRSYRSTLRTSPVEAST